MKKIIIAAAAAMMAFGAMAVETTAHTLVITKKSGETVEYKFAQTPVATFPGNDMVISLGATGEKFTYPVAEVATLTVTPRTLGVEDAVAAPSAVFEYNGHELTCRSLTPGAPVCLYTLDGKMLLTATADSDGVAVTAIGDLTSGVYVVNAGNESFKFIK